MNITVIVIPGLDAPIWPWPLSLLVDAYFKFWDLNTSEDNDWSAFKEYLMNKGIKTVISDRYNNFSKHSIFSESQKLAQTINNLPGSHLVLFSYSLGTTLTEEAVEQIKNKGKILKLISVDSPHQTAKLKILPSVKLINVYSRTDKYIDFANRMLYLKGYRKIENAENIELMNLKHGQFNKPDLFDRYFSLITS